MGCGASIEFAKGAMHMYNGMKLFGMMGKADKKNADRAVWPNPSWEHLEEALQVFVDYRDFNARAAKSAKDPVSQRFYLLEMAHVINHMSIMSHSEKFKLETGEGGLVQAINDYVVEEDGKKYKTIGGKQNWLHSGLFLYMLGLQFGNLNAVMTWHGKVLKGYNDTKLATTKNYKDSAGTLMAEVGDLTITALHVLLVLGEKAAVHDLLQGIGFTGGDEGFEKWWGAVSKHFDHMGTFPKPTWYAMYRLLMLLAAPEGVIPKEEAERMVPSPAELGELNKAWFTCAFGMASVLNLGARAYEQLGDDAKASEVAKVGISKDQQKKKAVAADCYCVLGRVAARSGDKEAAGKYFSAAAAEAREAKVFMMEVIPAKEWKRADQSAQGADEMLQKACESMGKSPDLFTDLKLVELK